MQRKWMFLFTVLALFSLILSPIGSAGAQGLLPPNDRIPILAADTFGWVQSNISGFGDVNNDAVWALSTFDGQMYAGTSNENGAQIWRSADGQNWSQFTPGWSASNNTVMDMVSFGSYFYVGVANMAGGEIWRTDGLTWSEVISGGFEDANNYGINSFAVFSNAIYAATSNVNGTLHIYRSATGNLGSWTPVVSNGFGSNGVDQDVSLLVYGSYLYIGLGRNGVCELWRTNNGTTWSPVFTNGLAAHNTNVTAMANFDGILYIALRNITAGGEVWSSTDGTNFSPVFTGGLGDSSNGRPTGLNVFNGFLYLVFSNVTRGAEVWRTADGTNWEKVSSGGWGDGNNGFADYYNKSATIFNNSLFIGTDNPVSGGEIWRILASFTDVPISNWAWSWIERLYAAGITSGCSTSPLLYCPDDSVTRAQMAKFLEKGIHGSSYTPPAGTGMVFVDVPSSNWAVDWIENLYSDGITSGCLTSPLSYCPDQTVTRDQMAKFLLVAKHGAGYTPPAVGGSTGFGDVSTSYWAAPWIKQLAAEGITSGCGGGNYCPGDPVTRAQMAKFLVLTFNLP